MNATLIGYNDIKNNNRSEGGGSEWSKVIEDNRKEQWNNRNSNLTVVLLKKYFLIKLDHMRKYIGKISKPWSQYFKRLRKV